MLGKDLAELRQGLFRAILLVARDQDDVLALAGAVEAIVDHPGIGRRGMTRYEDNDRHPDHRTVRHSHGCSFVNGLQSALL